MSNTIYISNTDTSVLSAAVASGYYFINPVDNSNNYYTNSATSMTFDPSSTWQQSFSGTTFAGEELVYKRKTYINSTDFSTNTNVIWLPNTKIYSSFSPIKFNLSGINDETNPIIQIDFKPEDVVIKSVNQTSVIVYNNNTVANLLNGDSNNLYNPKYHIFEYKFDLNDNTKTFFPTFSAYRRDGLIDEYVVPIIISKDSVYNVSEKINLLDTQILPLSSQDPLLKIELEQPDYVNNVVIKRGITSTPTRTITPTPTQFATPTHTRTKTYTRTRSYTPTRTRTKTYTRTMTNTQTVTSTTLLSPTPSKSGIYFYTPPPKPDIPDPEDECESYEYTVTFEGLNDTVDPSTIYIGFIYGNATKEIYAVQPDKVFGLNSVKVNVPTDITNSLLQSFVYFTNDDPGLTILNFEQTDVCSLEATSKIKTLPDPKPRIGIPPTPSKSYKTTNDLRTGGLTPEYTPPPPKSVYTTGDVDKDDIITTFQSVFTFTYDNQIPRLECKYETSNGAEVFQSGNENNDWSSQYYQIANVCKGKLIVRWFLIKTNLSIVNLAPYAKDAYQNPIETPPYTVTTILDSGVWVPPNVTNVTAGPNGTQTVGRIETSTPFYTPFEVNQTNNQKLLLWYNVKYFNTRSGFEDQQWEYYKEITSEGFDPCDVLIDNFDTTTPPDPDWPEFSTLPACPAFDINYTAIADVLSIDEWERQGRPTNTIQIIS